MEQVIVKEGEREDLFALKWQELQAIYQELVNRPKVQAKRQKAALAIALGLVLVASLLLLVAFRVGDWSTAGKLSMAVAVYVACCYGGYAFANLGETCQSHLHTRVMRYEPICEPAFQAHIVLPANRGLLEDPFIMVWLEEERKALFAAAGWPDWPKRS